MKMHRRIIALALALTTVVTANFAYAAGINHADFERVVLTTEDPRTDPEAVIVPGGRTSTAPFGTFPASTNAIDSLSVIKGSVSFYETGVGAHYYAFGSKSTTYSEAFSNIKLPTSLNVGQRVAFISLGIHGDIRGVDLGLKNVGDGWMPVYYDGYGDTFVEYPSYISPSTATNAVIVVKPVDTTTIQMYVQFLDANGNNVGTTFWKQIPVKAGNFTSTSGKVNCQYYRFASLVPQLNTTDNQKDGTYMLNGQFTNCQLYNGSSYVNWGIGNSTIVYAWKVSPERISFSYSGTTDTFSIDHWG